jgi:pimeloyl-ACP methyl ester carboxylesterase
VDDQEQVQPDEHGGDDDDENGGDGRRAIVSVPAITLEGDANGAPHPDPASYAEKFTGRYTHSLIAGGVGHNLPQEAPEAFAEAVVEVGGY